MPKNTPSSNAPTQDYLVLARKYRPQTFNQLVGQEALVQTLTNAIATQKIHHAYVLTGIRGTGKTTTARLMAMALNCDNGPATTWKEDDAQAKSIAQGRHSDVLEFDAASHRGVEDIADLFEGVAYAPLEGRYKIYIIDEVHMLSKHAFNALLKTLEEPPERVKFIFATTEVNKIPATVLSRCQRFDLKRVTVETLTTHYKNILKQENITAEESALTHIARAADGSVRDGLSLLDQAIALSGKEGITASIVGTMLGQADSQKLYDLLNCIFEGNAVTTLETLTNLYAHGLDAAQTVNDLLHLTHLLTRLKIVPTLAGSATLTEQETTYAVPMAKSISLENLSRIYQMLLQTATDVHTAHRPFEALEMATVRLCYLANLPPVDFLLKQTPHDIQSATPSKNTSIPSDKGDTPDDDSRKDEKNISSPKKGLKRDSKGIKGTQKGTEPPKKPDLSTAGAPQSPKMPANSLISPSKDENIPQNTPPWEEELPITHVAEETPQKLDKAFSKTDSWENIVHTVKSYKIGLGSALEQQVQCVSCEGTTLSLSFKKGLHDPTRLIRDLRLFLNDLTEQSWGISRADASPKNAPETLSEAKNRKKATAITSAQKAPAVQDLLNAFPGSTVIDVA